jgi:hypothetical protein
LKPILSTFDHAISGENHTTSYTKTVPAQRLIERLDEHIGSVAIELTANDLSEIKNAMSQIAVVGDRY